jgi:hypothetical protein
VGKWGDTTREAVGLKNLTEFAKDNAHLPGSLADNKY